MDIPPFLKISSNLLKRYPSGSSSLLKHKNIDFLESNNTKPFEFGSQNDKILSGKVYSNSLESLLSLNIDDSVDFIYFFLTNSNFSFKERLTYNLKLLSGSNLVTKKISRRDTKIITHRILSIEDYLSLTHISQLIFSLNGSNPNLLYLNSELLRLYLNKLNETKFNLTVKDYLYSNFLVLTCLTIFRRNIVENKTKLLGNGLSESDKSFSDFISKDFKEVGDGILYHLESILLNEKLNLNNEECLLFMKTMSITNRGNENIFRQLFSFLDIKQMTIEEMCGLLHTSVLCSTDDSQLEILKTGVLVSDNINFETSKDFYRVSFPLCISKRVSNQDICKWILNKLVTNCDLYIKELSNFLFVLMSVSSHLRIEQNNQSNSGHRNKQEFLNTYLETDIFEKALIYLNESEKGTYFPSERSSLLYLFDKTIELINECDDDQFIQLLQSLTHKFIKTNTSIKLKLLNECKKRVNSISVGGLFHVLQFVVWIHGNKNPDLINILKEYMERILSDITTFNVGDHSLLQRSSLYEDSFLTDTKSLSNVLYFMDWAGIHSPELSKEVSTLISRNNYDMIKGAELRDISHIVHYIALSNIDFTIFDPLYIIVSQTLRNSEDVHPRDLIMVLESMTLNCSHTRHKSLLEEIEKKALSISGTSSTIQALSDTLSRLTDVKYTLKQDGTKSFIINLSS